MKTIQSITNLVNGLAVLMDGLNRLIPSIIELVNMVTNYFSKHLNHVRIVPLVA